MLDAGDIVIPKVESYTNNTVVVK